MNVILNIIVRCVHDHRLVKNKVQEFKGVK